MLDFRHQSRLETSVCDELGRLLVRTCQTVPHGVVVFLPSYSYEAHLVRHWRQSGIWTELQRCKQVHREPKSSSQLDASLKSYARDAAAQGAVLFSVIGGKMSEGINFANDMARCVLVVGLPYPDITDPILQEKMAAVDRQAAASFANNNNNKGSGVTGQAYYQNLCMRAVNQSVGRAIRHANDYATILLVDSRYQTDPRIWSGLPNWLKKGAPNNWRSSQEPFEARMDQVKGFFANR